MNEKLMTFPQAVRGRIINRGDSGYTMTAIPREELGIDPTLGVKAYQTKIKDTIEEEAERENGSFGLAKLDGTNYSVLVLQHRARGIMCDRGEFAQYHIIYMHTSKFEELSHDFFPIYDTTIKSDLGPKHYEKRELLSPLEVKIDPNYKLNNLETLSTMVRGDNAILEKMIEILITGSTLRIERKATNAFDNAKMLSGLLNTLPIQLREAIIIYQNSDRYKPINRYSKIGCNSIRFNVHEYYDDINKMAVPPANILTGNNQYAKLAAKYLIDRDYNKLDELTKGDLAKKVVDELPQNVANIKQKIETNAQRIELEREMRKRQNQEERTQHRKEKGFLGRFIDKFL
jgi:hypothetical protein